MPTVEEKDEITSMLTYFWCEKGDITRWVEYEETKHLYPSVLEAVKEYEAAKRNVHTAITSLWGDDD